MKTEARIVNINPNLKDFIEIITNIDEKPLIFLIDSQADCCIVKKKNIGSNLELNTDDTMILRGITPEGIESFGSICPHLKFDDTLIEHEFQVVEDSFPIPSDGIIGKDFIFKYFCTLNYFDMTFTIKLPDKEFSIPIQMGPSTDTIAIPPRSEVFRCLHIENFEKTCLIEKQELTPGVFTADTIAHDNKPLVRILNTTTNTVTISNKIDKTIDLENFNIYTINKEHKSIERQKKIRKLLENKVQKQYSEKLLNLCEEYSDIFALEEDKLTVNNFYKQNIRLSDTTPVYTKNYRLPKMHKEEIDRQVTKLIENDLIEASHSCYNSPIMLVPKKSQNGEKKWRLVIDYKRLNSKIIPDSTVLFYLRFILRISSNRIGKRNFKRSNIIFNR